MRKPLHQPTVACYCGNPREAGEPTCFRRSCREQHARINPRPATSRGDIRALIVERGQEDSHVESR